MLRTLNSLLACRPGRAEYLSTKDIKEEGDERQKAIDDFNKKRITMFNRFLGYIPTECHLSSNKGSKEFFKVRFPTMRSNELVFCVFDVLSRLSWEMEHKELMSETIVEYVYYAMKVCQEEGTILIKGMQIFYSLIYRCEPAQQMILCGDSIGLLNFVKRNHGGDLAVMRASRKLELALKKDGWRGNVEKLIEMEMKGLKIPKKYLQNSNWQREFSENFRFPLEAAEDERIEKEEEEEELRLEAEKLKEEELEYQRTKSAERAASKERAASREKSRENTPQRIKKANDDLEESRKEFSGLFAGGERSGESIDGDDSIQRVPTAGDDGGSVGVLGADDITRRRSVRFPDVELSNVNYLDGAKGGMGFDDDGSLMDHINNLGAQIEEFKAGTKIDTENGVVPFGFGLDGGDSIISEMTGGYGLDGGDSIENMSPDIKRPGTSDTTERKYDEADAKQSGNLGNLSPRQNKEVKDSK
jgi:hypothetical protein